MSFQVKVETLAFPPYTNTSYNHQGVGYGTTVLLIIIDRQHQHTKTN